MPNFDKIDFEDFEKPQSADSDWIDFEGTGEIALPQEPEVIAEPNRFVSDFIVPTAKSIPRVVGAAAGSLALLPGAGIRSAIELLPKISHDPDKLLEAGNLSKAGEVFEQIMSVPGKLIKTEEEAKAVENIGYAMKPFEMAGEGWRLIGESANKGLKELGFDDTYIEPLLATYGEAAAIFALPELVRGIRNSVTFRKMTIPERGLVIQNLADTVKNNPNMTEGQILRKYNNSAWREEALKARAKPEAPITEPIATPEVPPEPPSTVTTKLGKEVATAIKAEKAPSPIAVLAKRELEIQEGKIDFEAPAEIEQSEKKDIVVTQQRQLETEQIADTFEKEPMTEGMKREVLMRKFQVEPKVIKEEIPPEPKEVTPKAVKTMEMKPKKAEVPFMITKQTEADLGKLGYTSEDINKMKPEEAQGIAKGEVGKEVEKEPWKMTREEYIAKYSDEDGDFMASSAVRESGMVASDVLPALDKGLKDPIDMYRYATVKKAISENKPVPQSILAEYPDLAKPQPTAKKAEAVKEPWNYLDATHPDSMYLSWDSLKHKGTFIGGENLTPQQKIEYHTLWIDRINKELKQVRGLTVTDKGIKWANKAAQKQKTDDVKNLIEQRRAHESKLKDLAPAKPQAIALPAEKPSDLVGLTIETEPIPKPAPKKAKVEVAEKPKKIPSKIRTLKGAIKELGGMNFLNFTGELKSLPIFTQKAIANKNGPGIDKAIDELIADGWLPQDTTVASFLEEARTNPEFFSRDRITSDITTKKPHELSAEEKRVKAEMETEVESPPEGEYITMNAEDLPEGKKMTLLENKTSRGWDIYEISEKDPFEITLKDGVTITLSPKDKVQVLKKDVGKIKNIKVISPDGTYVDRSKTKVSKKDGIEATYYGVYGKDGVFKSWRTEAEVERIKTARGKKTLDLRQESYGKQKAITGKGAKEQLGLGLDVKKEDELFKKAKPAEKPEAKQQSDTTEFFSGLPIHKFPKAAKALENLYDKYIGSPLWNFLSETLPEKVGDRFALIDRINKGIILDYKKDPAFIEVRDEAELKILQARESAKELAALMTKFSSSEQVRISQIIKGGITATPKRYETAFEAIKRFQALEKELQDLGILGKDNRFKQLNRKEISTKFKEIDTINKKIELLKTKLKPIIKTGNVARKVTEDISEDIISSITDTKEGSFETKVTRASQINEDRVRQALLDRGFAEGEATQMIARIKDSVVPLEGKKGTLKEIRETIKSVVTKTITQEVEKLKTYSPSMMARARGSIVKDINKEIKNRNEILNRIRLHYKMSGKLYLRRAYEKVESEKGFLAKLMGYAFKRPRLVKGYNIRRQDLSYLYRRELGEIKKAPYLVYKGLSEETHDVLMMEMFNKISENKDWTVSPERLMAINSSTNEKLILKYKDFKPLPVTEKLGPLSGQLVDPYVWDDLNQSVTQTSDLIKAWDSVLTLWKTGKVVYNPATHARNMLSNIILADFGGLPPHRVDIYAQAARDLLLKSGYWTEAKTTSLLGTEWAGAEIKQFLKDTSDLKDGNFLTKSSDTIKSLLDKPGHAYQGIEQYFKLAVFINERKSGKSIKESAKHAEKYLFNYLKIPPAIRWAKRWYSPFVTFSYKAIPRFAETAIRKPWKIAKYGILMLAVEEITRRMNGESKEEVEQEKKVLPDYMRKKVLPAQLSHLRVPYKDKYGRSKYLDMSFILPWGDIAEQWGQSRLVGRPLLPSHPLYVAITEIYMNEIAFTGQELTIKDVDSGSDYMMKIGTQIWRQAAPSLAGSYSYNKLMAAYKGEKDWALRDRSLPEAIFDVFFGLKIRSIDYTEERNKRMTYYSSRISKIKQEFEKDYNKIVFNPTPDVEHDRQRTVRLYEKMDERINKILDKITEIE